ncbi:MAG: hypothetical protein PUE18_10840, partial [Firmicutes bacterium]|nr:hypothetical protein [Bacillota bacterium]
MEKTGWKYGNDHKWRYEIDDSKAVVRTSGGADLLSDPDYKRMNELLQKFMLAKMTKGEASEYNTLSKKFEGRKVKILSHILSHDTLYEAYPQLKTVGIEVIPYGPNVARAAYNKSINTIKIREDAYRRADELKRTLLHETQHAIQSIEGFERGGNKELALKIVRKEIAKFIDKIMPIEMETARKEDEAAGDKDYPRSTALVDDFIKKYYNLDKIDDDVKYEFYRNLMGEKEARAVTERANFSNAERREAYPNYDRGAFRRRDYEDGGSEALSYNDEALSDEILPSKNLSSGVYGSGQSDSKRFVQSKDRRNGGQQIRRIEVEVPNEGTFFNGEKTEFSLSDSEGRQLTKEQQEYFKDSKVRDENGNLLTVYHGSKNKFNEFTSDINWFSSSKEYSNNYGKEANLFNKVTKTEPKKSKVTFETHLNI